MSRSKARAGWYAHPYNDKSSCAPLYAEECSRLWTLLHRKRGVDAPGSRAWSVASAAAMIRGRAIVLKDERRSPPPPATRSECESPCITSRNSMLKLVIFLLLTMQF